MKIRVKETGKIVDVSGEFVYLMYMENIMDWINNNEYVGWEATQQIITHWQKYLAECDEAHDKLTEIIEQWIPLKQDEAWKCVRDLGVFSDPDLIPANCRGAIDKLKQKFLT